MIERQKTKISKISQNSPLTLFSTQGRFKELKLKKKLNRSGIMADFTRFSNICKISVSIITMLIVFVFLKSKLVY